MKKENLFNELEKLKNINYMIDNQFTEEINIIENMLYENEYKVAVIGEFSTGKSTFINALLGKRLLYSSNIEATGAVTAIQYGEKQYAQIMNKNHELVDEFDILSNNDIKKLNDYLDIKHREKNKVDRINIYYPIKGLDKDILLLDTPGIEKMSIEQLQLTKQVLQQVNAIIFLVKKEGFTGPALKVLAGKDNDIGKISTKNIFIVMTRIGEIFDNNSYEDSILKINKLKDDIKLKLIDIGIDNVPIYALDSRDYLWSQDNDLYNEVYKTSFDNNGIVIKKILSQKEYEERSGFIEFKAQFMKFLDKDERAITYLRDIADKINFIAEEMLQVVENQKKKEYEDDSKFIQKLNKNIELACKNQRIFYNKISRILSKYITDFGENINKDIEEKKDNKDAYANIINKQINSLEDLTEKNFNKCLEKVKLENNKFKLEIEREINKQKLILINVYLKKCFDEEFIKYFNGKVKFNINIDIEDIKINLKQKENFSYLDCDFIKEFKKKLDKEEEKLKEYEEKIEFLVVIDKVEDVKRKLEYKKKEYENNYKKELDRLGERPEPKQRYRTKRWTTGHLFWKKEHVAEVPDGLDYSICDEWDEKLESIQNKYGKLLNDIYSKEEKNNPKIMELRNLKNKKNKVEEKIYKYKKELKKLEENLAKIKQNNKILFMDNKKNEILSVCSEISQSFFNEFQEEVNSYLYSLKNRINEKLKKEINEILREYKEKLIKESKEIISSIEVKKKSSDELKHELQKIKEEMNYEF